MVGAMSHRQGIEAAASGRYFPCGVSGQRHRDPTAPCCFCADPPGTGCLEAGCGRAHWAWLAQRWGGSSCPGPGCCLQQPAALALLRTALPVTAHCLKGRTPRERARPPPQVFPAGRGWVFTLGETLRRHAPGEAHGAQYSSTLLLLGVGQPRSCREQVDAAHGAQNPGG